MKPVFNKKLSEKDVKKSIKKKKYLELMLDPDLPLENKKAINPKNLPQPAKLKPISEVKKAKIKETNTRLDPKVKKARLYQKKYIQLQDKRTGNRFHTTTRQYVAEKRPGLYNEDLLREIGFIE